MAFEVHICWHIYSNNLIFFFKLYMPYCDIYLQMTVAGHWDIHTQCCRHICPRAYANTVKCMYTSPSSHIVDGSELIQGIYTDIVISYLHLNLSA